MIDPSHTLPTKRKHPLAIGVGVSFLLHVLVIALMFVVPYALLLWMLGKTSAKEPEITVVMLHPAEITRPPDPDPVRVVTEPEQVTGEMVEPRIEQQIAQAQQRTPEENQQSLEQLAKRLENVSSDESVDELTGKFQSWLGTSPRATQPAEKPVAGDFDFDTAQLHDVRREPQEDGGWRYIEVLLDAEGRTMEVEVDAEQGESAYQTFQRLKRFPLAEKVYRQITMPLIDKLMKTGENAADAQRQLEQAKRENEQVPAEPPPPQ